MKQYKITYVGGILSPATETIIAPNKTIARQSFLGERMKGIKIIRIEETRKIYIAYGSNLNIRQMKRRCPDAELLSIGSLKNWTLDFRGSKTGSYATIHRKKGSLVPVALWKISKRDEENLDRYEGYPRFYQKKNVYVFANNGEKIKGMVYIMRSDARLGQPSDYYIETIRQGYVDTGLDTDYLETFLINNRFNLQKMR